MFVWELTVRGLPGDVLKGHTFHLTTHPQHRTDKICLCSRCSLSQQFFVTSNISFISSRPTFNYILAPCQTLVKIPVTSLMILGVLGYTGPNEGLAKQCTEGTCYSLNDPPTTLHRL